MDSKQPLQVTWLVSSTLQRMSQYWIGDISFSLALLRDFLDDIEADNNAYDVNYSLTSGSGTANKSSNDDNNSDSDMAGGIPKLTSFIG